MHADDLDDLLEDLTQPLRSGATIFEDLQASAGVDAKSQTLKALGRLTSADTILKGLVFRALHKMHGKRMPFEDKSHRISALIANFVLGLSVVEVAIFEARYLQAAALLRQEAELLANLIETRNGKIEDSKPPHIAVLGTLLRKTYGELSDIVHTKKRYPISVTSVAGAEHEMGDETAVTGLTPRANADSARMAFAYHLCFMEKFVRELDHDLRERYDSSFSDLEIGCLNIVWQILEAEQLICRGMPRD